MEIMEVQVEMEWQLLLMQVQLLERVVVEQEQQIMVLQWDQVVLVVEELVLRDLERQQLMVRLIQVVEVEVIILVVQVDQVDLVVQV
tara:strand:+ start:360 stop:620 length:261 start_codon:yes stop_codon:yes gene_type:complete